MTVRSFHTNVQTQIIFVTASSLPISLTRCFGFLHPKIRGGTFNYSFFWCEEGEGGHKQILFYSIYGCFRQYWSFLEAIFKFLTKTHNSGTVCLILKIPMPADSSFQALSSLLNCLFLYKTAWSHRDHSTMDCRPLSIGVY